MGTARRGGALIGASEGEHAEVDLLMRGFDRAVALVGYGLLVVSPFMVGVPAAVSLALAIAHRSDPHPISRSHYHFQVQIFWTAAVLLAVGVGAFVAGGGVALTDVAGAVQSRFTGFALPDWMVAAYHHPDERQDGDLMMEIGVVLALSGLAYLILAPLWGAFKLVLGRPIGKTRWSRSGALL